MTTTESLRKIFKNNCNGPTEGRGEKSRQALILKKKIVMIKVTANKRSGKKEQILHRGGEINDTQQPQYHIYRRKIAPRMEKPTLHTRKKKQG